MADRIFPNTYQEEPLDSDLVFKGIDWDNFNKRVADNKEAKKAPTELMKALRDAYPETFDDVAEADDTKEASTKVSKETCPACNCDPCECDDDDDKEAKMEKKASPIVFNHPSQLSAEAVEAAIAAGDDRLKDAILAARHERRVRLASKIESQIEAENEVNEKLAQRRAYRENLVAKVAKTEEKAQRKAEKKANKEEFVKVSEAGKKARNAFAQKALAEGFPQEYVDAILGNNETVEVDNTEEIRNVMSSELSPNVKKAAVESMVKVATLTDADYSRLIRYWKEELGYGDQEWIDALFTKKYD